MDNWAVLIVFGISHITFAVKTILNFFNMKRLTLLLLSILSVTTGFSIEQLSSEEHVTQVTLQGITTKQPRSGTVSNVNCYYYDGRLYVEFYQYVEDVNISVMSFATGELYEIHNTECNQSLYLDVSRTSGEYYVEIEFDSSILYGYYRL